MLGCCSQVEAQQLKVPKFKKIIELVNQGVNLRKEPNTTSPRLVGWFLGDRALLKRGGVINDTDKWRLQFAWENEAGGKGKLAKAKYLLVVDEDDEWYHALPLIGNLEVYQASNKLVYVSKKVCRVKSSKLLSSSYFEKFYTFTSGKYRGYSCFQDYAESSFYETFFMGRIENGVGFGWTVVDDRFDKTKRNPDNYSSDYDLHRMKIVVGEKVVYTDNHGEPFDEVDGIGCYDFFTDEYEGELVGL